MGGNNKQGLTSDEFYPFLTKAQKVAKDLSRNSFLGAGDILALARRSDDIKHFLPIAVKLREKFSKVIILGSGGSGLGGKAITAIADAYATGAPELFFLDNLDPFAMNRITAAADFIHTAFIVISKSGSTAETLAQYLILYDAAHKIVGQSPEHNFIIITDPCDNPLRRIASERGHTILDHDEGVGGRFSVLSIVGMLPAALAGLDVFAIRAGAKATLERTLSGNDVACDPPVIGAAVSLALARHRGAVMSVMMPYLECLDPFTLWYRQLWAESLGKEGRGTTPIRALGPVDQHSQIQLYLDGPQDKMFTIIACNISGVGPKIPPQRLDEPAITPFSGIRIGDLVEAQQQAIVETLVERGRPTRNIKIQKLNEFSMGAIFMHFILETIIASRILEVNAFDQPAVEQGKILTHAILNNQKTVFQKN